MPQDSRFFEGRDHTESEVAEVFADYSEEGVYQHADQQLLVYAPGGLQVNVSAGRAIVQGFWFRLTVVTGLPITYNGSGQQRYDRVVLRAERGSNRVLLAIREGVPGVLTPPALQRAVGGDWEISLAWVHIGPGVTDITAADIGDERGYDSVCGWANHQSFIGAPSVNGLPRFAGFTDDRNTGLMNPSEDQLHVMCGAKGMGYFTSSSVGIGSYNTPTTLRAGGASGYGRERIVVDANFIGIGRDGDGVGTGPASIEIGTSTATTALYIGNQGSTSTTIRGQVYFQPPTNGMLVWTIPDGTYTGLFMQASSGTRQGLLVFGTAASQGIGGAGDISLYTAGVAAGNVILGTAGVPRLVVSPNSIAFGYQIPRSYGFCFQQANANAIDYGMRLFHTNMVAHGDWFVDDASRHVWGTNNVPSMWLNFAGQFTVGGGMPRDTGFNFQQAANNSTYGLRMWHTNQVWHVDWFADDQLRSTWAINDTIQMRMYNGAFSLGYGCPARDAGWNYLQAANNQSYGMQVWHTNQVWHSDWFTDTAGRSVHTANGTPRFHIGINGQITIGLTATDLAALHIPASFGDSEASGIRLSSPYGTVSTGAGKFWVRGDGIVFFGSQNTTVLFYHTPSVVAPVSDNTHSLGIAGARWSDVQSVSATIPTIVGVTINPTGNGAGSVGDGAHLWGSMYTNNGYKPGGGSWASPSDERMKVPESITPFTDGIDMLMAMEPIRYRYNGKYGITQEREYVGFSAQSLEQVAPEMVSSIKLREHDGADEEDLKVVDTSPLIFLLLNAMKEHETRLRALERTA